MNDYKNNTKLENMEKELYLAGCRTNQKVRYSTGIQKCDLKKICIFSLPSGCLRIALPSKPQQWS